MDPKIPEKVQKKDRFMSSPLILGSNLDLIVVEGPTAPFSHLSKHSSLLSIQQLETRIQRQLLQDQNLLIPLQQLKHHSGETQPHYFYSTSHYHHHQQQQPHNYHHHHHHHQQKHNQQYFAAQFSPPPTSAYDCVYPTGGGNEHAETRHNLHSPPEKWFTPPHGSSTIEPIDLMERSTAAAYQAGVHGASLTPPIMPILHSSMLHANTNTPSHYNHAYNSHHQAHQHPNPNQHCHHHNNHHHPHQNQNQQQHNHQYPCYNCSRNTDNGGTFQPSDMYLARSGAAYHSPVPSAHTQLQYSQTGTHVLQQPTQTNSMSSSSHAVAPATQYAANFFNAATSHSSASNQYKNIISSDAAKFATHVPFPHQVVHSKGSSNVTSLGETVARDHKNHHYHYHNNDNNNNQYHEYQHHHYQHLNQHQQHHQHTQGDQQGPKISHPYGTVTTSPTAPNQKQHNLFLPCADGCTAPLEATATETSSTWQRKQYWTGNGPKQIAAAAPQLSLAAIATAQSASQVYPHSINPSVVLSAAAATEAATATKSSNEVLSDPCYGAQSDQIEGPFGPPDASVFEAVGGRRRTSGGGAYDANEQGGGWYYYSTLVPQHQHQNQQQQPPPSTHMQMQTYCLAQQPDHGQRSFEASGPGQQEGGPSIPSHGMPEPCDTSRKKHRHCKKSAATTETAADASSAIRPAERLRKKPRDALTLRHSGRGHERRSVKGTTTSSSSLLHQNSDDGIQPAAVDDGTVCEDASIEAEIATLALAPATETTDTAPAPCLHIPFDTTTTTSLSSSSASASNSNSNSEEGEIPVTDSAAPHQYQSESMSVSTSPKSKSESETACELSTEQRAKKPEERRRLRKSAEEQRSHRRETHNAVERRRREIMNTRFDELLEALNWTCEPTTTRSSPPTAPVAQVVDGGETVAVAATTQANNNDNDELSSYGEVDMHPPFYLHNMQSGTLGSRIQQIHSGVKPSRLQALKIACEYVRASNETIRLLRERVRDLEFALEHHRRLGTAGTTHAAESNCGESIALLSMNSSSGLGGNGDGSKANMSIGRKSDSDG